MILERCALELSRELLGPRAQQPRPDHELQIAFDVLEILLESELNKVGPSDSRAEWDREMALTCFKLA